MNPLFYSPDLPYDAVSSDWRIQREIWLGMSQKYKAKHRQLNQKGIVKVEHEPTIFAEFCWSRLARMAGLPSAPAQMLHFSQQFLRSHRLSIPVGTLIWWIYSQDSEWLWRCKSEFIRQEGIDEAIVAKLKAFALWAHPSGGEVGEFLLSKEKTPFLVDHQDAFFLIREDHLHIDQFMIKRHLVDDKQMEHAKSFWDALPRILEMEAWPSFYELACQVPMDISPFSDSKGSLGDHIQNMLLHRRPTFI